MSDDVPEWKPGQQNTPVVIDLFLSALERDQIIAVCETKGPPNSTVVYYVSHELIV